MQFEVVYRVFASRAGCVAFYVLWIINVMGCARAYDGALIMHSRVAATQN